MGWLLVPMLLAIKLFGRSITVAGGSIVRKPLFLFAAIVGLMVISESVFAIAEDWVEVPPGEYPALFQQLDLYNPVSHSSPSGPPEYMQLFDPLDYCSTPVEQRMMNALRVIMNTGVSVAQARDVVLADRPTAHTDQYYVADPYDYPNGLPSSIAGYFVKAFPPGSQGARGFGDLFYFHDGCK